MNGLSRRRLTLVITAVAVTLFLHTAWTHVSLQRSYSMLDLVDSEMKFPALEDYVQSEARPPFSFRVLVPQILRFSQSIIGDSAIAGRQFPLDSSLNITMMIIDWLSCLIAAFFAYLIIKRQLRETPYQWVALLAPFLLIWVIYFNYLAVPNRSIFYPYDFPELAFSAAILWATLDPRQYVRASLVVLIPLAVLNKETALFFLLFFAVVRVFTGSVGWADVSIAITSGILGILAKFATIAIAGIGVDQFDIVIEPEEVKTMGAAGLFELQIARNLQQMGRPMFWILFATNFGFLWIMLLYFRQWTKDRLSISVFAMVILWFLIMLTVGVSRELRIYGPMVFPIMWIIARSLELSCTSGRAIFSQNR